MLKMVFSNYFFYFYVLFTVNKVNGQSDVEAVLAERIRSISKSYLNPTQSSQWQAELTQHGNWSDVDYTSGCDARRANWPAQDHWHRILTMASSWNENPNNETQLLNSISIALDYWFDRDFTHDDCINAGGNSDLNCPCGTPGFWNSNWYDQMILIPNLVGNTCLLLLPALTPTQLSNCTIQTSRAYVRIDGDPNGSMGPQTGANLLDVSSTGVSLSLMTSNETLFKEAYARIFEECTVTLDANKDGIKVDGSYLQHSRQLYTGNYGKVFINNMLKFFKETKNATSLYPIEIVQESFYKLIEGAEWFIYLKSNKSELSWQYSVIGRMVSHKYEDWHGIDISLVEILQAVDGWDNYFKFQEIVARLYSSQSTGNPGELQGTQFFYITDYLVHRGPTYVTTLKMYSSRTTNSECNNGQNPYGFHLSDGSMYTYLSGDEYTNVFGAFDWNSVPGTTTSYNTTPLKCYSVQFKGKEDFVGGTALGNAGVAVMNYTNPNGMGMTFLNLTSNTNATGDGENVHWLKTFFFFPSAHVVSFVGKVETDFTAGNVITTLEQSQLLSNVYVDGSLVNSDFIQRLATSVWHNGVLYSFMKPLNLTVDLRERRSNWEEIGISQGNETHRFFHAYFTHSPEEVGENYSYVVRVGADPEGPGGPEEGQITILPFTGQATVRGASYVDNSGGMYVGFVFVTPGEYETGIDEVSRITSDSPATILLRKVNESEWELAVSDPTQKLIEIGIQIWFGESGDPRSFLVDLPQGPYAGSSVVVNITAI